MTHEESITTTEYAFTALFRPLKNGSYVVTFPAIPNLATEGESLEEARDRAAACLRSYLEARLENHLPLPESEHQRFEAIRSLVTVNLRAI